MILTLKKNQIFECEAALLMAVLTLFDCFGDIPHVFFQVALKAKTIWNDKAKQIMKSKISKIQCVAASFLTVSEVSREFVIIF